MQYHTRTKVNLFSSVLFGIIFSFILTILQLLEVWIPYLNPKKKEVAPVTYRLPEYLIFRTTIVRTEVIKDNLIVGRKEVIGEEEGSILSAYISYYKEHWIGFSTGLFMFNFIFAFLFSLYLKKSGGRASLLRTQFLIFLTFICILIAAKLFLLLTTLPIYYVILPTAGFIATLLLELKHKLIISLFLSLIFSSLVGFHPSVFLVMGVLCYLSLYFYRDYKRPFKMILAGSIGGWITLLLLMSTSLIFKGKIYLEELIYPEASPFIAVVVNGFLSGLISVVLWKPVVGFAGLITRGELLELQELNNPLLKLLEEKAPGTFQHSRAMANIAEGAANAIGADGLLVRVGAHYHDIGKMLQPEYFTENQSLLGIKENPHDKLSPKESVEVIFSHVIEGTNLLRKKGFKESIVEFVYTHHGTSVVEYFFTKAKEKNLDVNIEDFKYPGMKPISKETAILMLVDAIEAASRTVEPSQEAYQKLVEKIVFSKLLYGELDESGLSIKELKIICEYIIKNLLEASHTRIKYQWQEEKKISTSKITDSDAYLQAIPKEYIDDKKKITSTPPNLSQDNLTKDEK